MPTEKQIIDKIIEKNNLDKIKFYIILKNLKITDIKPKSAKLNYKYPHIYLDTININFTSNINLNKIITNNNLGDFITDNLSNPTEQQIKDKLKELNSQLDITKISITNITNTIATITSNDENIYTKNVIVNYTVSVDSNNW